MKRCDTCFSLYTEKTEERHSSGGCKTRRLDGDIRFSYEDVPTIKGFTESTAFIRGLMGPFGSGKSSGCVIELIKLANKQAIGPEGKKRARFAVIRNTYRQLEDTTIKTMHDWLPPHKFGKNNTWLKSEHTYFITQLSPDLEIEILYRALDRPEHVSNLLSLELTSAWINEAREVPYAIIEALQGRIGRYPSMREGGPVNPCIIMDTNPPDTDSWWYRFFEEQRLDGVEIFKQPSGASELAENKSNLRRSYYEDLLKTMEPETAKVYIHGEYGFIKDGKPIYPEYCDSVHCQDIEPIAGIQVYRGWDFGITPACTFSQILPTGQWLTFDEMTADSVGIEAFAEAVLEHCDRNYSWMRNPIDIGDPSGEQRTSMSIEKEEKSCFDVLHGKGIMIEGGDQTLAIRIGSVKHALNKLIAGKPGLVIHSRCKMLRKGYQGKYQYRRLKISGSQERFHDTPDKNDYSHPHDANQYVAARIFGAAVRGKTMNEFFSKKIEYDTRGIV